MSCVWHTLMCPSLQASFGVPCCDSSRRAVCQHRYVNPNYNACYMQVVVPSIHHARNVYNLSVWYFLHLAPLNINQPDNFPHLTPPFLSTPSSPHPSCPLHPHPTLLVLSLPILLFRCSPRPSQLWTWLALVRRCFTHDLFWLF